VTLSGEQLPHDRERLLEPRDTVVEGHTEGAELLLVPPGAERDHEPPARQLVDSGGCARENARRMERGARDERTDLDTLRDRGEPRQRRPAIPRPALAAAVAAVEQMVADPDRVVPALLDGARHRRELVASHDTLDLRELDTDLHAQNASKAGGSDGIAVMCRQTPSSCSISSTWSMSSSRPSRRPCAR